MLLGATLGGAPAGASVNLVRDDIALPGAPDSVELGDLDGVHGKDIVMAFSRLGTVGVMLNDGDGTFAAVQQYPVGPECGTGQPGVAADVTLGDVTQPAPGNRLVPDGKLDAYVACSPYVVRLTGNGAGALTNPEPYNRNVAQYTGGTPDVLALAHRPDDNPSPLLVFQRAVIVGQQLCVTYDVADNADPVCKTDVPVGGPMAVADLNGAFPGVPPDETVIGATGGIGILGFAHQIPTYFAESSRPVPGGVESITIGDLDKNGLLDVLVGQFVNSVDDRVASIHFFKMAPPELQQVGTTLPSIPGLDAVAIADIDGDGCNDVVGAGGYGRGVVHLGDGTGNFTYGQDMPQLGYLDPFTATRVTMAVGDLTGDGLPEIVVADQRAGQVMVYRNASTQLGSACSGAPPVATNDVATITENAGATTIDVLANDTDPDGGPKFVGSLTQPAHGTAAIAGSGLTYRPAADYCNDLAGGAPDTFTYTLNGGSTATVAVTVECVLDVTPPPPPPPPSPAPRTCEAPGTVPFIVGTPGADVLVGTGVHDVLSGRGGDDCLFGLGGEDRMTGGTGVDLLNGGSSDDRINGGAGVDLLIGGGGSDQLKGDAGDDKFRGGNGNDEITPGAGKDNVAAQGGDDIIYARDGARDTIDCGAGRDKVKADRNDSVKNCERRTFN